MHLSLSRKAKAEAISGDASVPHPAVADAGYVQPRPMTPEIRPEHSSDISAIRDVVIAAFKNVPYSNQTEGGIVDALRAAHALSVSLVAVDQGEIVGHVAFSPVMIAHAQGDWYGLGPVAVRPDRWKQGIGRKLVTEGLRSLAALRAAGCVVLGDPCYYQQFGFEADPALTYGGKPSPYFQRLVLDGPPASGEVGYHAAFGAANSAPRVLRDGRALQKDDL